MRFLLPWWGEAGGQCLGSPARSGWVVPAQNPFGILILCGQGCDEPTCCSLGPWYTPGQMEHPHLPRVPLTTVAGHTGKHWGVAETLVGRQQPGAQGKNGFNKWIHKHLQNHQSIKN